MNLTKFKSTIGGNLFSLSGWFIFIATIMFKVAISDDNVYCGTPYVFMLMYIYFPISYSLLGISYIIYIFETTAKRKIKNEFILNNKLYNLIFLFGLIFSSLFICFLIFGVLYAIFMVLSAIFFGD